jgi:hypothetical protein
MCNIKNNEIYKSDYLLPSIKVMTRCFQIKNFRKYKNTPKILNNNKIDFIKDNNIVRPKYNILINNKIIGEISGSASDYYINELLVDYDFTKINIQDIKEDEVTIEMTGWVDIKKIKNPYKVKSLKEIYPNIYI